MAFAGILLRCEYEEIVYYNLLEYSLHFTIEKVIRSYVSRNCNDLSVGQRKLSEVRKKSES